jgi:hypothetical protein
VAQAREGLTLLIVTNGSSAVGTMERAGIAGDKLPWDDVLHDGPIPAHLTLEQLSQVRARFIADCGWGESPEIAERFRQRDAGLASAAEHDEVVLWLEHDLYDQLQLLQVLDWFGAPAHRPSRLSLVCHDRFVSHLDDDQARADFAHRRPVTDNQVRLAIDAWAAVRAPSPEGVVDLLNGDTAALPFLAPALERFLEELPGKDGLARSERQILAVVADGAREIRTAFPAAQALEFAVYLGDASFIRYVGRLARGQAPLLRQVGELLELTDLGVAVLDGRDDSIRVNGIDRWWGGTRLATDNLWRWDAERRSLRAPKRRVEE